MAFQKFVKDNLILLTGILLPILLVVLFMVASTLPRMLATPPQYDFLFTANQYHSNLNSPVSLSLKVDDKTGKLAAIVTPNQKREHDYYRNNNFPVVYRYDAQHRTARALNHAYFREFLQENGDRLLEDKNVEMPEFLSGLTLDKNVISPDGYTLDTDYRRSNDSLAGFMFSMGRSGRYRNYRLKKGNASFSFEVSGTDGNHYYYGNSFTFLGWVMEDETKGRAE
ncbi:MAG: hypothetical protein HND56_05605 [Pseudomonadota bacterium]|nr:hypothetical protein [Pseudomonadota bacterium]QKK05196.1 MAG: hypothetical protein HND56_05605 [Pseudomonadota bacterium]